jgi:hypothetical protein
MLGRFDVLSGRHHIDPSVCQWWYNFAVAWMESAGRNFGLYALGVLGGGLGLAFYERSRCVDAPDIPAAA